jgi:hypothetical protein
MTPHGWLAALKPGDTVAHIGRNTHGHRGTFMMGPRVVAKVTATQIVLAAEPDGRAYRFSRRTGQEHGAIDIYRGRIEPLADAPAVAGGEGAA